jgi:hypothetical protein
MADEKRAPSSGSSKAGAHHTEGPNGLHSAAAERGFAATDE